MSLGMNGSETLRHESNMEAGFCQRRYPNDFPGFKGSLFPAHSVAVAWVCIRALHLQTEHKL